MTIGNSAGNNRRMALMCRAMTFLLALVLACWVLPGTAAGQKWGLEQLMQSLREVKQVKARFVERKQLAILDSALESSGTLEYDARGRLEKRVLKPRPESLVLEGDRLTLESGGQRRSIALRDNPVVGTFVESIRSTLAGDLAMLRKLFKVSLEGNEAKWRLVLVPNETRMRGFVTEIRLAGRGAWVETIEFLEGQGDHSVMTILRDGS